VGDARMKARMKKTPITVGHKKIGGDNPCFIIAEVGINHNGDIKLAKKLIDVAAQAGCDAVKFQAYKTSHLYSKRAGRLDWKDKGEKYSYDIYSSNKSFEMPADWVPKLINYATKQNLIFFSSVWDEPSSDFLEKKGMGLYKIGSSAVTNLPLIEHVAKKRKPVILSIAGSTLGEVEEAIATVQRYNKDMVVLHCHLKYPTELKDVNMNIMKTLMYAFPDLILGYSDHTMHPFKAPVAAVAAGAKVIEKHITLDKEMKGPDHFFALEPDELALMVKKIREAEERIKKGKKIDVNPIIMGSSGLKTYPDEAYLRKFAYTTIITVKDIKKGEKLTKSNVRVLRPGKIKRGLEPRFYKLLVRKGFKVVRDIPLGKAIMWDDLIEKE
jgi:N-acetylneuraminate synthase